MQWVTQMITPSKDSGPDRTSHGILGQGRDGIPFHVSGQDIPLASQAQHLNWDISYPEYQDRAGCRHALFHWKTKHLHSTGFKTLIIYHLVLISCIYLLVLMSKLKGISHDDALVKYASILHVWISSWDYICLRISLILYKLHLYCKIYNNNNKLWPEISLTWSNHEFCGTNMGCQGKDLPRESWLGHE